MTTTINTPTVLMRLDALILALAFTLYISSVVDDNWQGFDDSVFVPCEAPAFFAGPGVCFCVQGFTTYGVDWAEAVYNLPKNLPHDGGFTRVSLGWCTPTQLANIFDKYAD